MTKPMTLTDQMPVTLAVPQRATTGRAPRRSLDRAVCSIAMVLTDVLALLVPMAVLASGTARPALADTLLPLALIAAASLAMNLLQGLYPGDRLHLQESLKRRARTAVLCLLLLPALYVYAPPAQLHNIGGAMLALLAGLLLQRPLRRAMRLQLHRAGLWGTPTVFIAPRQLRETLTDFFQTHWRYGLRPVAGEARIAVLARRPDTTTALLLRQQYQEVIVLADMPHLRISGLNPADIDGAIGFAVGPTGSAGYAVAKRLIDIAIALPLLVLTAPLMLGGALCIWAVDPGPVHYIQSREGLGGRKVGVLKLRTMYRDADARLQTLLQTDAQARAEWAHHFKLRRDPRLLPSVGAFLRATSIDELPQLINVLRGEMSLVGPRPFPDYHLAAMPPAFRAKRASVMPGITGLWQITSRSDADLSQQQQLDEHYIDNRSLWFDLQIILGTLPALLLRKGAY